MNLAQLVSCSIEKCSTLIYFEGKNRWMEGGKKNMSRGGGEEEKERIEGVREGKRETEEEYK